MSEHPREAPDEIREQIVEALKDERRAYFYHSSSTFLDEWDIERNELRLQLVDFLEGHQLFLKPREPQQKQKYQCRLIYEESEDDFEIEIHATLSTASDPIEVRIAVHKSDTVRKLEIRPIKPPNNEKP